MCYPQINIVLNKFASGQIAPMQKKKEIDVIDKILEACYKSAQFPLFIMSLMHQYEERGSLSKKQLQGLYYKAEKVEDIPANWLATLEAVIAKMPNRYKSEVVVSAAPVFTPDEQAGKTHPRHT